MATDFSVKTNRNLNDALNGLSRSFEKLSSGLRINRAADDAAGLAILSQLEANDAGRGAVNRNISDAVSLTNIQDGAIGQIQDIGIRLSELSIQSQNGTLSDTDREALNLEYSALTQEVGRIAESTTFNGRQVFGSEQITIQAGLGNNANAQYNLPKIDIAALTSSLQASSIGTQGDANSAVGVIETFRTGLNQVIGNLGAAQSSLSRLGDNNEGQRINEAFAASRIRDVDVADAVASKTKFEILAQSGVALAAQTKNIQSSIAAQLLS